MPFASKAQAALFFSKGSPVSKKTAKEWARKTNFKKLPKRVKAKGSKKGSKGSKKKSSK